MGSCDSQVQAVGPQEVSDELQTPLFDEWPSQFVEQIRASEKRATTRSSTAAPGKALLPNHRLGLPFGSCTLVHFLPSQDKELCVSPAHRRDCVDVPGVAAAAAGAAGKSVLAASTLTPNLLAMTECLQHLLGDVVGYLAHSPSDMLRFCTQVCPAISLNGEPAAATAWREMFERSWPACAECLKYHNAQNYRSLYEEMVTGRMEFCLEVFDREKKRGFLMSAMPAVVHWEANRGAQGCYIAKYVSASKVPPEPIPFAEAHRLRFCPSSARGPLRPPTFSPTGSPSVPAAIPPSPPGTAASEVFRNVCPDGRQPLYPHRVLSGFENLVVGKPVELQWKMQFGSPFGWWYGHLDRLSRHRDGVTAIASISFAHFPTNSRWHRLEVRFGDDLVRSCAFGGYTGGLRQVADAEHDRWMRFFPKHEIAVL